MQTVPMSKIFSPSDQPNVRDKTENGSIPLMTICLNKRSNITQFTKGILSQGKFFLNLRMCTMYR